VEHKSKSAQKDTAKNNDSNKNQIQKSRTISLNLRIKVLSRDKFRCVFCGKSPATDIGTQLHIDHIIPFSKGGTNTIDNLQTLCEKCNLGKSNEEI
jgi:5-methylcytosine-specific restriction endonuclease McrA